MTSARAQAIEALARMLAEAQGEDPDAINRLVSSDFYDAATTAFDAMVPALVWEARRGYAFVAGDYTVARVVDGSWMIWGANEPDDPIGNELSAAAAQAAADDHYIAQRLRGTKLWEQMEDME